jgi:radical SAM superfamily enzyme YgiQ (UPF0313 family)
MANFEVWIADLTYTQQTIAADAMPYAIGCIASYLRKNSSYVEAIRLFKYPEKLNEELDHGPAPDVIGFSNYVWNLELSHAIATQVKRVYPGTVIVFGGPNYPLDRERQVDFLKKYSSVDFYIVKEGELGFTRLVKELFEHGKDVETVKRMNLPSVHSIGSDGTEYMSDTMLRIDDMEQIPSPYTEGILDEFFDGNLLPVVQTNRGCPFSCTYCLEGTDYYNKVNRKSLNVVDAEFEYIGSKIHGLGDKYKRSDLFISDSNFGMYKEDIDTARAIKRTKDKYGWPAYINVATGKNNKERVLEVSRIIDGSLRLSGSVQSLDPKVLKNVNRKNINTQTLFELGLEGRKTGANTYSEIILGLPGDSFKAHIDTVRQVMDAGFTNVFLFQLMLLPGSVLGTTRSKQEYGMVTKFRVLPRCYGAYESVGGRIVSAEIEEICVASGTLSFDDYLKARKFHLIITIFYNDGLFESLLKLLRNLEISVFSWIETLLDDSGYGGLDTLFSSFENATRNELHDTREELEHFIQQDGVIEKYLKGELGNNLLFYHKTLAVTEYMKPLSELAGKTILKCLKGRIEKDPDLAIFVRDAAQYHYCRSVGIFSSGDSDSREEFTYDIERFIDDDTARSLSDYRYDQPKTITFRHEPEQKDLIAAYLGIYGDSTIGIGRILSKVHVKKLFRKASF